MTKRLQVLLQDREYREIQRMAQARHTSIAEWVRQALTNERRRESASDVDKKLRVIRAAARHEYPVADIEHMLAEIESGSLGDKRS